MPKFTFSLPAATGAEAAIEDTLSTGTRDEDLTYTGDDSIVWDRVNATRLRRGLPGLAAIGYPRPEDDTPAASGGDTFTVEGPPGMTEAQAREIFLQQSRAGSLVGLKSGDLINSATQAAGGLTGALGQLTQQIAGFGGSAQGAITGAFNRLTNSAQALPTSELLTSAKSVASRAVSGITSVLNTTPVTNGITAGDFAKQAQALAPVGNLDATQVKATLSQASKLVDQAADTVSDTKGLGKFGLDASQLETAGMVKTGTVSRYLAQGQNTVTSVLQSPAVWTGKNGVNGIGDLLSAPGKQDKIQQELMSTGLSRLQEFGVPTGLLDPQALAGTALNAAKSPEAALAWAQGQGLPADVKSAFDTAARDGAFAVNFGDTKISAAMAQTFPGLPAEDTVDRATLNAASQRVTGDPKIPEVSYSSVTPGLSGDELEQKFQAAGTRFTDLVDEFVATARKSDRQRAETNSYVDDIRLFERIVSDLTALDGEIAGLIRQAEQSDPGLQARLQKLKDIVNKQIATIEGAIQALQRFLASRTA